MKKSHKILTITALSIAASATLESLVPPGDTRGIEIVHTFFLAIMAFIWCKSHIQERGIEEPRGSSALCALFVIIGAPLYFYRGYGFKQGSIMFLYFIGLCIVLYMATTYTIGHVL